ncbi:MAG TPA: hypothetical protein VIL46_03480 [Gemmataceae bacterium]
MDRSVQVSRCKRTGAFLLNPFGTFRGYGAYVGVNPYREVSADATDEALGRAVVELLALSGPTGIPFAQAREFFEEGQDDETVRIRSRYGLTRRGLTTSKLARRFLQACVEQRHGNRSWVVQPYRYSPRDRSMSGEGQPAARIRHCAGPAALRLLCEPRWRCPCRAGPGRLRRCGDLNLPSCGGGASRWTCASD